MKLTPCFLKSVLKSTLDIARNSISIVFSAIVGCHFHRSFYFYGILFFDNFAARARFSPHPGENPTK